VFDSSTGNQATQPASGSISVFFPIDHVPSMAMGLEFALDNINRGFVYSDIYKSMYFPL
jgi:hypothetical protein